MAGGRGSRINDPNKPLIEVLGKPMIEYVVDAVSGLGAVYVATTRGHDRIIEWARSSGYDVVLTSGRDYPSDLVEALRAVGTPALVLPGDMPLLSRGFIIKFLRAAAYVRTPMVTLVAVRSSEYVYTGISYVRELVIINGVIPWTTLATPWTTELLNVNTREDLERAVEALGGGH
ncbi:MAG: NTP transferase domain-containing protein [Vulcanisaeta sp.]|nr:NTP transferase domain-containing protein [Vulcanisaeta sp.]